MTFGSMNAAIKANRPTRLWWARVLQEVPSARMLVHAPTAYHEAQTRADLENAGIARHRVDFSRYVPRLQYFQRYCNFDVVLDTTPFSGGTTTFDSLWMGVPVVTLSGRTGVGRGGVSILSNLGLPELIARTPDEYVEIAVGLAEDRARLAELRAGLRQRMQASPLMDGKQYARDVEAAFRQMWRTWCRS